jgi:hypothetical protein
MAEWLPAGNAHGHNGLTALPGFGLAHAPAQAQSCDEYRPTPKAAKSMSATAPARMTADEFIAWAMAQPEG